MKLSTLSGREKKLAIGVGAAVLVFGSFMLLERVQGESSRLKSEIESRSKQLKMMQNLVADSTAAESRDAWLNATQPQLTNPDGAGVALLDEVKHIAQKHGVLLENPAIRPVENHPTHASVAVEVESKSFWGPLIAFQYDLQTPAQFIALESMNLKIDPADPTKMRGRFKISRWFAAR